MDNIILIGMPASGKSTVGVVLAKALGMGFVDTDLLIQRQCGKKLEEIIKEEGIDAFLDIEEGVCKALRAENAVISTGGSVVYREGAMGHFQRLGKIVFLEVGIRELKRRISDMRSRGVVLRDGQTIEDLYAERRPLYEKYAGITINEDGLALEETVAAIIAALASR